MRSLLSAYIAEFGPLSLAAEALAIATVFVLIGVAFGVTP